ncbi:hypothetical protein SapgrDRAFT_2818 [Saprospira grandis DSM 2844]|uniref:Cas10/Cmr2 second palm domain-containing protein n=1 Tax=Saprospira grandis DSM 2844 TaxID=694433 RepID=J1I7R4_9BACT|nr:hypothetical protein [Saprospira grandis]EJF54473.1 hypothetical protein SapgrDRAFT_2818 [Saprospira grandis DSM 2844]
MSKKYLYSASVQGIQSFIFQTNKLKEIAGASELVEQLSTRDTLKHVLGTAFNKENLIVAAAGKIKYLCDDLAACEKLCQYMPIYVSQEAPGLQLSQSVVLVDGAFKEEHYSRSEQALDQKRAFIGRPNTEGWMIADRAPQTGKPIYEYLKKEALDRAQVLKRNIVSPGEKTSLATKLLDDLDKEFPTELSKLTAKDDNWLAVIYADGNDLGIKIPDLLKEREKTLGSYQKASREFSEGLENANVEAFKKATAVLITHLEEGGELEIDKDTGKYKLPLRPIICGGDDLVVVIQARYALFFCETYLSVFEEETKQKIDERLTACAGIAYMNVKYPFHYGFKLAKDLCSHAKNNSRGKGDEKGTTPASISFHKIETSFIRKYAEIEEEEIKYKDISAQPYFLYAKTGSSLEVLKKRLALLSQKDEKMKALSSRLRTVLGTVNQRTEDELLLDLDRVYQLYKRELDMLYDGLDGLLDIIKGSYDLIALKSLKSVIYKPQNK